MSWKKANQAGAKQQRKNEQAQQRADEAQERRERRKKVTRFTGKKCSFCREPAKWHDKMTGKNVCDTHKEQLKGM